MAMGSGNKGSRALAGSGSHCRSVSFNGSKGPAGLSRPGGSGAGDGAFQSLSNPLPSPITAMVGDYGLCRCDSPGSAWWLASRLAQRRNWDFPCYAGASLFRADLRYCSLDEPLASSEKQWHDPADSFQCAKISADGDHSLDP